MPDDKRVTKAAPDALAVAQGELLALDHRAEEAADDAVPANTRRAYELELACFASWCGRHGVRPMPAEPKVIRAYLQELAEKGRDPLDVASGRQPKGPFGHSSLTRALAAICRSHKKSGHASPWNHPLISEMRDTFARIKGIAPRKQKRDLGAHGEEALLFRVCDLISDDLRGLRDRAMILVGWAGGGRRRSEIAAALVEHFEPVEGGIRWLIPRSKADQTGRGLVVALTPGADERYCPVRSLGRWLAASGIERGPVFRGVDMATGKLLDAALAPEGVARRIQHYVKLLGLDPSDFGGHSLRSGFVTTAYKMGRKPIDIMESTGHRSENVMAGYIRRAGLVEESASRGLLDEALRRIPRPPPSPPPPPISAPAPAHAPPTTPADDLLSRFTKPFAPGGRK
jgi:integrase